MSEPLISIDCSTGFIRRYSGTMGARRPTHLGVMVNGIDSPDVIEDFRAKPPYDCRVTRDLPFLFPLACEA